MVTAAPTPLHLVQINLSALANRPAQKSVLQVNDGFAKSAFAKRKRCKKNFILTFVHTNAQPSEQHYPEMMFHSLKFYSSNSSQTKILYISFIRRFDSGYSILPVQDPFTFSTQIYAFDLSIAFVFLGSPLLSFIEEFVRSNKSQRRRIFEKMDLLLTKKESYRFPADEEKKQTNNPSRFRSVQKNHA